MSYRHTADVRHPVVLGIHLWPVGVGVVVFEGDNGIWFVEIQVGAVELVKSVRALRGENIMKIAPVRLHEAGCARLQVPIEFVGDYGVPRDDFLSSGLWALHSVWVSDGGLKAFRDRLAETELSAGAQDLRCLRLAIANQVFNGDFLTGADTIDEAEVRRCEKTKVVAILSV